MTRPKPPERRQGHANRRPRLEVVGVVPTDVPTPPAELGTVGVTLWTRLWEAGAGVYRADLDGPVVGRYCALTERRAALLASCENEGYTVPGSRGQLVAHPAARLLVETERELRSVEALLGLNPSDRARLGLVSARQVSKLDAIKAKRAAR